MTDRLSEQIEKAQMVLVGIGNEFAMRCEAMETDPFYGPLLEQAGGEEYEAQAVQYLRFHYIRRHPDGRLLAAYDRLAGLLDGKNYFLVSLCTDDLIYRSGLDAGRIVTPCGGFRAMQCGRECVTDQEPLVTDPNVTEALLESIDACGGNLDAVDFPVCAECTKPLWFNRIDSPDYREEGYLPDWQRYTKWLQGTLNRQLLVLELGVGMQFPQIIRFPFEKAVFFNQKARMIRVHSRLYQMTEELKEKGISVAQDPVDFLMEQTAGLSAAQEEQTAGLSAVQDPVDFLMEQTAGLSAAQEEQTAADLPPMQDGSGDDRDN